MVVVFSFIDMVAIQKQLYRGAELAAINEAQRKMVEPKMESLAVAKDVESVGGGFAWGR